jgi:serine/threonine-protein kinase
MRKLFDADNELALLDLVRNPQVPPPSSIAPDVPPALDQVVLTSLAVDPNNRYASCMHFRKALQQVIPESLGIDAPQLSSLLTTVMSDVIQEENQVLPESAVGTAAKLARSNLAAVSEFTVGLSGIMKGDITPPPLSAAVLNGADEPEEQTGEISISDAIGGTGTNTGLTPVSAAEGDYPATVMLEDMTPPPELQAAAAQLGLGGPATGPAPTGMPAGHGQVHPPHITGSMPAQSGSKSLMVVLIVAVLILAGAVGSLFVWRPWEAPSQPPSVAGADAAPVVPEDVAPLVEEVVEPEEDIPVVNEVAVDEPNEPAVAAEEQVAERVPDRSSRSSRRNNRNSSAMTAAVEMTAMPGMRTTTVDMTMILTGPVF